MARAALMAVPDRSARLRVITAGNVGHVETRLGSSGFDVVAVVDTEAELVVAVGHSDPDAIVVEADLCESLEHVHDLAPDAALIVVGDHTPAGALGHIDRGVTGTVLAGLIQALAAGGAAAVAAVPGFTPATPAVRLGHLAHPPRQALGAGAAGTVVAAAIAVSIFGGVSSDPRRPELMPSSPPSVSAPAQSPGEASPSDVVPLSPRIAHDVRPPVDELGRQPIRGSTDVPPSSTIETPSESPPDAPPPPAEPEGTHPPGHAKGWEHKPPKHDDHGHHEGWTKGHGPKD